MRTPSTMCGVLAFALALAIGGGRASATQCNIDLTNTGTVPAFGVVITLPGVQTINPTTGIYSGGAGDDVFHTVTVQVVAGNTVITWTNPTAAYAPHAAAVQGHVGFTPSSGHCDIVNFDFTNQSGVPLSGIGIPYVEVHWTSGQFTVVNNFPYPVTIISPRGAVVNTLPLSALNRFDSTLNSQLTSLGSEETIAPGSYYSWHWPWPPPCIECSNIGVFQVYSPTAIGMVDFYVEALQ